MTDAGVKEVAGHKELVVLSLADSKITDAGVKELVGFKDLIHID